MTWTQVGTTLTTDNGWTGTIDPASGEFSMTVPAGPCADSSRAGTVAPDALSFTGVETVVTGPMCHHFSYLVTGSRYECGNGTVDPFEQCDDDDNANGDGCDAFCQFETCSSCDDGNPCTLDTCDGTMTCGAHVPDVRSYRSAAKSTLVVKASAPGSSDKLTWKWRKGQSTNTAEFADPRTSATYTFCLFAGTSAAVVGYAAIPPDLVKWSATGTGFKYSDTTGAADGIRKILLKGSLENRTKIIVKGKGTALAIDPPPFAPPLTAQLTNSATNVCWSTAYDSGAVTANQTGVFKAKTTSP